MEVLEILLEINRYSSPVLEKKYGKNSECVIKAHSHPDLTLGFVLEGETVVTVGKKEFYIGKDSIILIPQNIIHLCKPQDKNNFEYLVLHIDGKWLDEILGINPSGVKVINGGCSFIRENNEDIDEEQLLTLMVDFNLSPVILKENSEFPQYIKEFIDNNYSSPISLDYLSEKFNMNKFSLIRSFKKEFNLSPHAYIINSRINRAKIMIKNGESLSKISVSCGFYDQSHFVKRFKEYTGLTPENYK